MKLKRRLLNLVKISSVYILTNCSLVPPNAEVCVTLISGNAYCTYTLDDKERYIDEQTWKSMQLGRMSMSPEDFSKYQVFVEQSCEIAKCTSEQKDAQKKILQKMNKINEKIY